MTDSMYCMYLLYTCMVTDPFCAFKIDLNLENTLENLLMQNEVTHIVIPVFQEFPMNYELGQNKGLIFVQFTLAKRP